MDNVTFTLTFGDQAENHVGMQKIGEGLAAEGFGVQQLAALRDKLEDQGTLCELVDLKQTLQDSCPQTLREAAPAELEASVLIIRQGIKKVFGVEHDDFFNEQSSLQHDKKAFMYGRVVNKHARHNLCFSDTAQEPNYSAGKGRVIALEDVPCLKRIRDGLPDLLGPAASELSVEGNYYYDTSRCGIGFHGDSERKKVVGVRLGSVMPLHWQWFHQGAPVGKRVVRNLEGGDVYIVSEKATGWDWKRKLVPTLRHAAGCEKFTQLKAKSIPAAGR